MTHDSGAQSGLLGIFLPWPLALLAFCSFLALAWFSMACLDFDGTNYWSSRTTAGWFILGSPFILGMGLSYAALVASSARHGYKVICLALLACLLLLAVSVRWSSPEGRLAAIVGERAAQHATIERLKIVDSFNDGETAWGVISGPEDLLREIAEDRSLEMTADSSPDPRLRRPFPELFPELESDESQPEIGDAVSNQRAAFFRRRSSGQIYFWRK